MTKERLEELNRLERLINASKYLWHDNKKVDPDMFQTLAMWDEDFWHEFVALRKKYYTKYEKMFEEA